MVPGQKCNEHTGDRQGFFRGKTGIGFGIVLGSQATTLISSLGRRLVDLWCTVELLG